MDSISVNPFLMFIKQILSLPIPYRPYLSYLYTLMAPSLSIASSLCLPAFLGLSGSLCAPWVGLLTEPGDLAP